MAKKINPNDPTWIAIVAQVSNRMASLRVRLENNLPFEETQSIRASLTELKGILSLVETDEILAAAPPELPY